MKPNTSPLTTLVSRLIPGVRYPWLVAILTGLFAIDLVIPDPIPFLDEVGLAVLTVLLASWRTRRDDTRPPPKDITPPEESEFSLPSKIDKSDSGPDRDT